jgi:hypothetical protein
MSFLTRLLRALIHRPEWVVCVRCGQEGHKSHQCKKWVAGN